MTRRRVLKGIASGIVGAFVSRNNDVGGYWVLGLLCRLSRRLGCQCITIRLVNLDNTTDAPALIQNVECTFAQKLTLLLSNGRLDSTWIKRAAIDVEFGTSGKPPIPPQNTRGDPYLCTVTIMDDLGKTHAVSVAGRCGPHDPSKESKSTRGARECTAQAQLII